MSGKTFFSVIMPTRNRAELLPLAVQSVLSQTFGDFEIIISDNHSSDKTPQVVQSFGDNRIKYFRSEKSLSIGDSLEFALSHATGEYVTCLSDDDAYGKIFLETLFRVIEEENTDIVSCKLSYYYARDKYEYGRTIPSETLVMPQFSRKLFVLNREESVSALFATAGLTAGKDKWKSISFPVLVNSAFRNSMIEKVKVRISKLFPIIGSDIYSSAIFLNAANKYCYIDEPLYLHRIWEEGITSSGLANFQKYAEELKYVPLKKYVSVMNYHANAMLLAKSDWGEDFQLLSMDLSKYFVSYYQEIKCLQMSGVDISEELEEFERELLSQDENVRIKVQGINSSQSNYLKILLRSKLKNSIIGKAALRLKHRRITILNSKDNDFKNILECSKKIDEDFLNKYANN